RHQAGLGGARGGQRGVGADRDVRAQAAVVRLDPLQVQADDLDGRDFLARDHPRQVGDRGKGEFGVHRTRYCVVGSTAPSGRSSSVASRRSAALTAGRSASSSSTLHAKPATCAARRRVSTSNTSFIARSLTRYAGDRKAALVIGRRTAWLIVLIVLVALVAVGVAVFNFAPEI